MYIITKLLGGMREIELRLRIEYERNKRGIHTKQESKLKFYNQEEHNEVIKELRVMLGKRFDYLMKEQRVSKEGKEIYYYTGDDLECKFDDNGDCIEHESIKNYVAHGYIEIKN